MTSLEIIAYPHAHILSNTELYLIFLVILMLPKANFFEIISTDAYQTVPFKKVKTVFTKSNIAQGISELHVAYQHLSNSSSSAHSSMSDLQC